jgi:hypothetical protein
MGSCVPAASPGLILLRISNKENMKTLNEKILALLWEIHQAATERGLDHIADEMQTAIRSMQITINKEI